MRSILVIMTLLVAALSARAEDAYPSKPVRIIDAYAAGGSSDLAMRLLIDAFSRELGQTAYIEVKSGGGGLVGAAALMSVPADGYTLLLAGTALMVVLPAARTVNYDPVRDFVPLALVWHTPQVLAVKPELKVNTLSEFIAYAKGRPDGVTVGSAGVGTVTHLSVELLKREAGIPVTHIPFRGTGTSLTALVGNQVDAIFGDVTMLAPYVSSKAIKAMAITGGHRSRLLPDLATAAEKGLPGLGTTSWFGLVAPAQTPPAAIARLKDALQKAEADPAYRQSVAARGLTIGQWDAASFEKLFQQERDKWTPIIHEAGIKLQ